MEDDALSGVQHLLFLNISHNSLNRFNSDVFKGKIARIVYIIKMKLRELSSPLSFHVDLISF